MQGKKKISVLTAQSEFEKLDKNAIFSTQEKYRRKKFKKAPIFVKEKKYKSFFLRAENFSRGS